METKQKNITVESLSKNWNDTSTAFYFVTLHTKNKYPYLGPTQIGDIAFRYWAELPKQFPFVELDACTITPHEVCGILFLNRPKYESWRTNFFKPQSENLASVIRNYKDAVKKYAVTNRIEFDWQAKYSEHIIQSEVGLETIRKHITRK
jgi:putative transposase